MESGWMCRHAYSKNTYIHIIYIYLYTSQSTGSYIQNTYIHIIYIYNRRACLPVGRELQDVKCDGADGLGAQVLDHAGGHLFSLCVCVCVVFIVNASRGESSLSICIYVHTPIHTIPSAGT